MRALRLLCGLVLIGIGGCGSKSASDVSIILTPATVFADPNVADAVFEFTNVGSPVLDQDGNSQPDYFIRPATCDTGFAPVCGVSLSSSGEIPIGELPLNYQYEIRVRLRNSAGENLWQGTTQFLNENGAPSVTVTMSAVP